MRRRRLGVALGAAPVMLVIALDACGTDRAPYVSQEDAGAGRPTSSVGFASSGFATSGSAIPDLSRPRSRIDDGGPPIPCRDGEGIPPDRLFFVAEPDGGDRGGRIDIDDEEMDLGPSVGSVTLPSGVEPLELPTLALVRGTPGVVGPTFFGIASTGPNEVRFSMLWTLFASQWGQARAPAVGDSFTLRASFPVADDGGTRTVEVETELVACGMAGYPFRWATSGELCSIECEPVETP